MVVLYDGGGGDGVDGGGGDSSFCFAIHPSINPFIYPHIHPSTRPRTFIYPSILLFAIAGVKVAVDICLKLISCLT